MKANSLYDIFNEYVKYVYSVSTVKQYTRIINETKSTVIRDLLPFLGYKSCETRRKTTQNETQRAIEFMKSVSLDTFIDYIAEISIDKVIEKRESESSRRIYGARLNKFIQWCKKNQITWIDNKPLIIDAQCPRLDNGYKSYKNNHLTGRRFILLKYKLQSEEISVDLATELQKFENFLVAPYFPKRQFPSVSHRSAKNYVQDIKLFLGWFYRYQNVQEKALNFDVLVPQLGQDDIDDCLSSSFNLKEHERWGESVDYIKNWLVKYWMFLSKEAGSNSPRTRRFKTQALKKIGLYQYRDLILSKEDYKRIPVLQFIDEIDQYIRAECREWERFGKRVVDHDQVWPDLVEGQTALLTIRNQVVEPLRHACKIIYANKSQRRSSSAITTSHQRYLSWALLTDLPAQRQQEYRGIKVSLYCSIQRPSSVPIQGLYHPKVDLVEDENSNDAIQKIFLYKTYSFKDEISTKGKWVIEVVNYKTEYLYGTRVYQIANRVFPDGQTFYDYLERYLYGCWQPGTEFNHLIVNWRNIYQSGAEGNWIMAGRSGLPVCSDYQTIGHNYLKADWGYLFVKPRSGNCYTDSEYAGFVSTASHSQIKKRISPHRMRHIWATWAYQVGLTDNQLESLAFKMGVSVYVLKEWYEQCSPEEKRRPIEEAIDILIFDQQDKSHPVDLVQIMQNLLELSPSERQQVIDQYL